MSFFGPSFGADDLELGFEAGDAEPFERWSDTGLGGSFRKAVLLADEVLVDVGFFTG